MSNTFLSPIVNALIGIVKPIKEAFNNEDSFKQFLTNFGWGATGSMPSSYSNVLSAISDLETLYEDIQSNSNSTEEDVLEVLSAFKDVYSIIKGINTAPSGVNSSEFLSEFPERLFEYLIVTYLNNYQPKIYNALSSLSVIQYEYIVETSTRLGYTRAKLDYDKLFDIVRNPLSLVQNAIGWGTQDFYFSFLANSILSSFASLGYPAEYGVTSGENYALYESEFGSYDYNKTIQMYPAALKIGSEYTLIKVSIIEVLAQNIDQTGVIIRLDLPSGIALDIPINDEFKITLNASLLIGASFGFYISPSGILFKNLTQIGSGFPNSELQLKFAYNPSSPRIIFGKPLGTRLLLSGIDLSLGAKYENNEVEIFLETDFKGLQFAINSGDSDGFIKKVFGEGEKKINLPIIVSWSSKHGIRFKGSGAFEITVNPNKPLGPIVFNELTLALKAIENQPLKTQIGATISGKIGPISFIVENIGIELKFDKNEGNAGPFGIDIGFKPPNGVGLKVKASKLEGGGYLYIDRDKGRYAGGIELDIFGKLRVTAVGIITTKNPDGTPGFSLLIAVGVEFPGIPVGFGFTFNGVGVLAGVNRTMNPNALRAGVKGGAINSLMFPKNVIENIKTLITDMESYFPIEQKKYTFGVFFLLKWGVGVPLVSIKLGVIISFPQPVRLAIVGIIQIALPDPNVPVLQLNVAFVGIIDFENKYISFDASIYDSRLLFITLYGDMAVRLFWGERREMLVSVGGFHPAYNAPAYLMLPKMDRMTLSIFDEKNLRLIIETYFAVTSNTVQFGVKLDFLLKVWKLKVLGWFGFDVLFQFNPFKFLSHVYAGLAVMWDDKELLCISLDFNLNGPGPWHAVGKGEFTVLGMKQSANFDETWGDEPDTSAPEIEVTPKLLDALNKDENWQGSLPEGRKTYVKLAVSGTGTLIMDPLGEFTITQKVLPFTINIERFGGQKVKDVGIYSLDLVKVNGVAITSPTSTKENFASAQFKEMNDNDKIKAPSFEFLPNGVKIGYDYSELMFGDFITKDIEYDVVLIDGENRTDINVLNTTIDINSFTKGGLISTNQISKKANRDIASPIDKVDFNQESYVLVSKDSLNTISTTSIGSLGNAYTERDKIYAKSPELKGMYEIIPA